MIHVIKKILRFLKILPIVLLPILTAYCVVMFWNAELIVDKIPYGIFMIAFMILMTDNTNNGGSNKMATN